MRRRALGIISFLIILGSVGAAPATGLDDTAPIGSLDWVRVDAADTITVGGWVLDPDEDRSLFIHIYVDDHLTKAARASGPRPDVAQRFGVDPRHGFHTAIAGTPHGEHDVCVWAINLPGPGNNQRIGCRRVRVGPEPSNPVGVVDRFTDTGRGALEVSGWVFDRDSRRSTPLHFYVDGALAGTATTGLRRDDVARVHGVGPRQGFRSRIDAGYGTHDVCVWAINQPAGPNVRIGCRQVNVTDSRPRATPRSPVSINGTGDVRADPHWYGSPPDYRPALAGLNGLFHDDDLTVINLECAPSLIGAAVAKNFNFRCDPGSLANFRASGVDVASMANNHALDYGTAAMVDGIANVEASGLHEVGAGLDDRDAYEPYLTEVNGTRIAVLGMAGFVEFGWNLAGPNRPGLADGYNPAAMAEATRRASAVADVVVVAIHWGREGVTVHNTSQTERGRTLIDAGADIVFGHHPHRLQPLEHYNGGVIFYSLGNFVWPRLSVGSADTAVGRAEIDPRGGIRACFLDATIRSHGRVSLDDPARRTC